MTQTRINKLKHEICFLCKCSNKQRKKFVQIISDDVIRAVADIAATLLYGNLGKKNSKQNRKKLRKHQKSLIELADSKITIKGKRKIIQKGGGVLSSIGGFIDKLLGI